MMNLSARRLFLTFGGSLTLALASGCVGPTRPTAPQLARGCVFMLPGVESGAWQLNEAVAGLREAGVDQAFDITEWGDRPFGSLTNLVSYARNRQRATDIARRIDEYVKTHPHCPLTLIGYSGGGGMAVFTAESLAPETRIDRLILIAAAVSPAYDLARAARHCREGIVNFYSSNDQLTLGVGTTLFGTMDRIFTPSAGRDGFRAHGLAFPLEQVAWTRDWLKLGHGGGHLGWLARAWSREVLAPRVQPN